MEQSLLIFLKLECESEAKINHFHHYCFSIITVLFFQEPDVDSLL